MYQPSQKRLLAPFEMMKALHHAELPVDGVMRLIEQGAGHGHTGVFEYGIPARFLVLEPLLHALPVSPTPATARLPFSAERVQTQTTYAVVMCETERPTTNATRGTIRIAAPHSLADQAFGWGACTILVSCSQGGHWSLARLVC